MSLVFVALVIMLVHSRRQPYRMGKSRWHKEGGTHIVCEKSVLCDAHLVFKTFCLFDLDTNPIKSELQFVHTHSALEEATRTYISVAIGCRDERLRTNI